MQLQRTDQKLCIILELHYACGQQPKYVTIDKIEVERCSFKKCMLPSLGQDYSFPRDSTENVFPLKKVFISFIHSESIGFLKNLIQFLFIPSSLVNTKIAKPEAFLISDNACNCLILCPEISFVMLFLWVIRYFRFINLI